MAYRGGSGTSPFGGIPIFGLRREIDRLFDDAFTGRAERGASWTPAMNVREDARGWQIEVELPGMSADDVEISVDNGILTVSGEKRARTEEGEEGRYHVVERSYGAFSRSVQLPQGIDEEQIAAECSDGVLTVRVPKAALPQPRRIQINAAGARGSRAPQPREVRAGGSPSGQPAGAAGVAGATGGAAKSAAGGSRRTATAGAGPAESSSDGGEPNGNSGGGAERGGRRG